MVQKCGSDARRSTGDSICNFHFSILNLQFPASDSNEMITKVRGTESVWVKTGLM